MKKLLLACQFNQTLPGDAIRVRSMYVRAYSQSCLLDRSSKKGNSFLLPLDTILLILASLPLERSTSFRSPLDLSTAAVEKGEKEDGEEDDTELFFITRSGYVLAELNKSGLNVGMSLRIKS